MENQNISQKEKPNYQALSIKLQQEQLKVSKKQLFHSRIIALLLLCLTLTIGACVVVITPKLNRMLADLSEISEEINAQDPVDIEGLNSAIEDLEKVLEPVANLLNLGR